MDALQSIFNAKIDKTTNCIMENEVEILDEKTKGNGECSNSSNIKSSKHQPIIFIEDDTKIKSVINSSKPSITLNQPASTSCSNLKNSLSRKCYLCPAYISKNEFIDHMSGKKHNLAVRKCNLSKAQKIDKDKRTLYVKKYDKKINCEIIDFYYDYGLVDVDEKKQNFFMLFDNRDNLEKALAAKYYTKNGIIIKGQRRQERIHTDDQKEVECDFKLGNAVNNKLLKMHSNVSDLEQTIDRLIDDIEMKPHEYERRKFIISQLEHSIGMSFHQSTFHVFGSSINGLGFRGADVDVVANLGYNPYDSPNGDAEELAAQLTKQLARILKKERWIQNVFAIPKARVPIVKGYVNGIQIDLSFRNKMPLLNSNLIRLFTRCHPLVKRYMMVIRLWAKIHNIAGGGKPAILITNYALCMMMAFVIMRKRKMIPTLLELRNCYYKREVINGWECGYNHNVSFYTNKEYTCSTLELVHEFFVYYRDFKADKYVICPLFGDLVIKGDMDSKARSRLPNALIDYIQAPGKLQTDKPLCVQDPFDLSHNVTRGLNDFSLVRFQTLCKNSAEIVDKILKCKIPLSNLFDRNELSNRFDEVGLEDDGEEDNILSQTIMRGLFEEEAVNEEDTEGTKIEVIEIMDTVTEESKVENSASDIQIISNKRPSNDDDCIILSKSSDSNSDSTCKISSTGLTLSIVDVDFLNETSKKENKLHRVTMNIYNKFNICDMSTGAIEHHPGKHDVESIRRVFLQVLTFMFQHVFISTSITFADVYDESPSKRQKGSENNSGKNVFNCIAKLTCCNVLMLTKGRLKLKEQFRDTALNPIALEMMTSRRMDKLTKLRTRERNPIDVVLFVCHNDDNIGTFTLIPYSTVKSVDRNDINNFWICFADILNKCFTAINTNIRTTKLTNKPF